MDIISLSWYAIGYIVDINLDIVSIVLVVLLYIVDINHGYSLPCPGTPLLYIVDINHGYSLHCPVGCENSLLQDAHHFYLLGEEQYERYKRFGTEEYVLQNNGVLCPFPGCGAGILIQDSCKQVVCHNCRFEFCRQCLNSYHGSSECRQQLLEDNTQDYKVDEERELRARWDQESLATIEEISKPCPGCCTKTERDGGCMHMHCSRCQMDWCWLCDREWNRECQGNHCVFSTSVCPFIFFCFDCEIDCPSQTYNLGPLGDFLYLCFFTGNFCLLNLCVL
ncbi:PARK2 [Mytilus edulis]|uniref:E3 ubiquitin-protein ligase parkin n=1 Tax=Mytilus edulis TaxID=6550 RepID=A0A8S3PQ01_MYTED|nr:PARK2 [Mytilus edulis]